MPLLEGERVVDDRWVTAAEGEAIAGDRPVIVKMARFEAERDTTLNGRNAPLGVLMAPDSRPDAIAQDLDHLDLIAVEFPKFRDGRGFTIGRTLRERYGFKGELRAVGHILPDQYPFLLRCGFTTVEIPAGQDPARWAEMLHLVHTAYQPAVTDDQPFSLLRRHIVTAE